MKQTTWPKILVNFAGWLLLLIGIYASLKTSFNILYYKNKYPVDPVIGFSFNYPKNEEDCYQITNPILPSQTSKQEKIALKKQQKKNLELCIKKIKRLRKETKIKDIWTSFMFLFIGSGILLTKRFYLK